MNLPQPTMFYVLTTNMTFYQLGRFSSWDEAIEADEKAAEENQHTTLWILSRSDAEALFDSMVEAF